MRSERIEETTEANRRAAASAARTAGWSRTALVGGGSAGRGRSAAALARLLALPENAPLAEIHAEAARALGHERAARARLEQELADARAEAARSERLAAVGRIASAAAHDLNNVLTAIVGYADLLELELGGDGAGSRMQVALPEARAVGASVATRPAGRSELDEIRSASARAAAIVEEVLGLARRSRGSERGAQAQAVDLSERLVRVESLLRRVAGPQIALGFRIEPGLPPVAIDSERLERALMNLVANARHAIEAARASQGRIEIRLASGEPTTRGDRPDGADDAGRGDRDGRRRRFVRLSVVDDGCGMSPEVEPRIFESFFTTRADRGGTGLGLAGVAELVRAAGGAIRVESEPGRGTAIHLEFPAANPLRPASESIGYPAPARGEDRCASGSTTCSASVPGG